MAYEMNYHNMLLYNTQFLYTVYTFQIPYTQYIYLTSLLHEKHLGMVPNLALAFLLHSSFAQATGVPVAIENTCEHTALDSTAEGILPIATIRLQSLPRLSEVA